ncbi:hypothetical protein CTAYLR_008282 [Chrysophaeum taylorii]|uniref:mitogen-activated protein kinase kinase n=1 Tax=Chrysophaeum taylorii TaxID=2483200 RepID=A0AAD7UBX7_9STRA|nr:hypothetical protein CTAYLR_008282 [Chrysophaeum taylorii]
MEAIRFERSELDDTIGRMGSTISSEGVSINATGLTVDGERMRGLSLGDIELEGMIGKGCSSVVRKARDKKNKVYAVKIFKIFDVHRRHQLMKEVRILFGLDCQALVHFFGAYLDDARVGVILEFMDLGSLDRVFAKRPPERIVSLILFPVLWGLAYLHFERRMHRDVKPANALVNSRGEVKLSDFGISRQVDDAARTMVGTFRYMSPERLDGADYSFEADVWSLGILALDAFDPVFATNSTPLDIVQHLKEKGNGLATAALRKHCVSTGFIRFVEACLRTNPNDRPACDALLQDPWLNAPRFWHHSDVSLDRAADLLKPWLLANLPPPTRSPPSPPFSSKYGGGGLAPDPLNQTFHGDDDDDDDDDGTYHDLAKTIQDDYDSDDDDDDASTPPS